MTAVQRHRPEGAYSSADVVEAIGVSYRQLHNWVRTGRVTPSVAFGAGSGRWWAWSEDDIEFLGAVCAHRSVGCTLDEAFARADGSERRAVFAPVIQLVTRSRRLEVDDPGAPAPLCASCDHWRPSDPDDEQPEHGTCWEIGAPCDADEVFITTAERGGQLRTRADFGCALHEPRRESEAPRG